MLKILTGMILCVILFACKKSSSGPEPAPPPVPVATIQDATQARLTSDAIMRFTVTLSKAAIIPATIDYSVTDGTAKAPKDYTAKSGTLTIAVGKSQGTIEIPIKGDPTANRENNLEFNLQLANAKGCALGTISAKGIILTEDGTSISTDNTGYSTPLTYPGYALTWNDEFEGTVVDANTWNFEIGNGASGWGNNELQYYTNSTKNVLVSNGNLVIEARKESISGFNYSSARLTTQNKKSFKFGRIDIRAKLPVSKGIWPALWMLGDNISTVGWPSCGEIDIMELVGTNPNRTHGTMHWKPVSGTNTSKGGSYTLATGDFSQKFHVFSIVWVENSIKWYVDDQLFFTGTAADMGGANYPFNAPEFFIFNVAVGGNWPGPPDGSTPFPQRMFVDYVRVFQ